MTRRVGWQDNRGITLLDLLVGLMLLAVGATGIFFGFKSALTGWTTGQQFVGEQHNARLTLDWLTRRLRMAGNENPNLRFDVADASEIVFYGNTDADVAIECYRVYLNATERVVYVNANEASCAGGVGQPLSANVEAKGFAVTSFVLRYFDQETGPGNELTAVPLSVLDRAKIRRVEVEVRVLGVQAGNAACQGSPIPAGCEASMTSQVILRSQ